MNAALSTVYVERLLSSIRSGKNKWLRTNEKRKAFSSAKTSVVESNAHNRHCMQGKFMK